MLYPAQLARAEYSVLQKVPLVAVRQASSLSQKRSVVILCVAFLLARQGLSGRVYADKKFDNIAELPVHFDDWQLVTSDEMLKPPSLHKGPANHLFRFSSRQV